MIEVEDGSVPTPPRVRLIVASTVAVAVLALVVGLVLVSARESDDAQVPPSTSAAETTDEQRTPLQILELLPAGPIDGKDSWRLPVVVTPQSGVVDGQTVTAIGRGFAPGEQVGVVMCTSEAGVEGVAACDLGTLASPYEHVTYANAGVDGGVIADVTLRQTITTPLSGPVDCRSAAERCLVAIGAVSDYDRSGGAFVVFADAPPFPEPTLVVAPPGPYSDGQPVTVSGAGLLATRQIDVLQCLGLRCVALASGHIGVDGTFVAEVAVVGSFVDAAGVEVSCEAECVLALGGVGLDEATSAPMPPPVALSPIAPVEPALPPSTPASILPTDSVRGGP